MLGCHARPVHLMLQDRSQRCLVRTLASHLPLCEREAVCTVSLAALQKWREWAAQRVLATGDELAKDGGPTAADLTKELDWLLDDAVESCQAGAAPCRTWREVRRCSGAGNCRVALRLELQGLRELWYRRLEQREPLQYLCNVAHWRDITLAVGAGVLIPRPETEQLIDLTQEALLLHPELREGTWADLGTGSGALAIGLASILLPGSRVLAVDCSASARDWANLNVQRLGLAASVQVLGGNWYSQLQEWQGQLSGVLSNPPYINSEQLPSLQAEVKLHEPSMALDGGCANGLQCLLEVCEGATNMLQPGGFLAVETAGGEQAHRLGSLLASHRDKKQKLAYEQVVVRNDLFGVQRFVTAHRRCC